MAPNVHRLTGVDFSAGMLAVAAGKLAPHISAGRCALHRADILGLPFADGAFHAVTVNQVLHHLPDDPAAGYPVLRRALREFARVLKPGGSLVVNTCDQHQLREGYWFLALVPAAMEALAVRLAPLETLVEIAGETGFGARGRFVPVDAVVQGERYFDPRGPLSEEWRDGDSTWALVPETELAQVCARLSSLDAGGELEAFVRRLDARRPQIGQITILHLVKKAT